MKEDTTELISNSNSKAEKAYRKAVYTHKKMLSAQWRAENYGKTVTVAGTEYFIEADGSYRNKNKAEKVKKGPKG